MLTYWENIHTYIHTYIPNFGLLLCLGSAQKFSVGGGFHSEFSVHLWAKAFSLVPRPKLNNKLPKKNVNDRKDNCITKGLLIISQIKHCKEGLTNFFGV